MAFLVRLFFLLLIFGSFYRWEGVISGVHYLRVIHPFYWSAMSHRVMQVVGGMWRERSVALMTVVAAVGGYALFRSATLLLFVGKQVSAQANLKRLEKNMVHLFVHHRWSHGPNFFTHCLKVETFLRLAKIPYTVHFTSDASTSPTGRLPFIVLNNTVLAESEFILRYLKDTYRVTLDDWLTPEEHARGRLVQRMSETTLNYGLQRTMLVDRPGVMQDMFAKEYHLDPHMAYKLVRKMRSTLINVLNAVGYGNFPNEQYPELFLREVQSVEVLVGTKPFLLGDSPTSYDCSLFGCLQVAREMGPHGPALSHIRNSRILCDYISRMTNVAFPDILELTTSDDALKFIPHEQDPTP